MFESNINVFYKSVLGAKKKKPGHKTFIFICRTTISKPYYKSEI